MSIILRSVKGSELTFAEVDGNFQSFFYSSSVSGDKLNLHFYDNTSQSINLSSIPSISASYAATASYVLNAQSASYVLQAVSASFASNIAPGTNITASNILITGTASIEYLQFVTSSVAFTSGSNLLGANSGNTQTLWGKVDLKSGPLLISGSTIASGSITAPSFTGSLQGTSSWANNAVTASYILNAVSSSYAATASYVQNAITASYALNSLSSSFAANSISSSYASSSTSASYATNALSASYASGSTSASYATNALSASFARTASYVLNAVSSSYATFAQNAFLATTASYTLYSSIANTALNAATASFATSSLSASYALNSTSASYASSSTSASYAFSSTSASYSQNALSASFSSTASYVLNAASSSQSVSSSYALTSSYSTYAENANTATSATTAGTATLASIATTAISASYASGSTSASYASSSTSASFAQNAATASFALSVVGGTFPFTGSAIISGSLRNIGNTILSGSTIIQSSSLTVATGSLIVSLLHDGVDNTTAATTIDRGSNLIPALSVTGSSNFNGALTVNVGTFTAKDNFISSGSATFTNGGVTVKSGITITGSTLITGSTSITGSTAIVGTTTITGSLRVSGGITGSLQGTSSWATRAISASNISQAIVNNTNDYILTATGGGTINGESALTFDGTSLINTAGGGIIKISDAVNNTTPSSGITSFVQLNALPDQIGAYYGETISGTAGENLSYGQIIVLNTTAHTWNRASAGAVNNLAFNLLGICLNNASMNNTITILLQGFVTTNYITITSFEPGQPLWLSNSTGTIQDTAPGSPRRRIGHMYQDIGGGYYNIRFNPDNDYN
jgi:hypothetical protein